MNDIARKKILKQIEAIDAKIKKCDSKLNAMKRTTLCLIYKVFA